MPKLSKQSRTNLKIKALYYEQVIDEVCSGDLHAWGHFGNPFRSLLTIADMQSHKAKARTLRLVSFKGDPLMAHREASV